MPDPIPVMVLARLAVDSAYQKQGLGSGLLKDAYSAPSRPLKLLAFARCCFMRCQTTRSASMDVPAFTSVRPIQ
jgi:hypothetical protein